MQLRRMSNKVIQLTQGKEAIVDADMYEELMKNKWCFGGQYAQRRQGSTSLLMHHAVIGKPPKGLMVDHINRNKLDNRRENLRFVTNQTNQYNREAKGYTWHKGKKKWMAQIKIKGKHKYLGYFTTEDEAHEAYLRAKEKLCPIK